MRSQRRRLAAARAALIGVLRDADPVSTGLIPT
jgi:hypothetical protein